MKEQYFSGRSQSSPICPSEKRNMWVKISVKQWWINTERGKQKYWWNTLRMLLYLPQIPCLMAWDRNKFSWNNRLHGLKAKIPLKFHLTLILLKWRIWWAPNNASKCRWGLIFNPLTFYLLIWRIWWAPNNASKCRWDLIRRLTL